MNGPGGWVLIQEPVLHLGEDVLVPDIAGWRNERMPRPSQHVFYTLAPDWVCEVLSPSTKALDRKEKLLIYARECVRNVWLIDPVARTLEVFRWVDARYRRLVVHEGSTPVRAEPFEAIELRVAFLWDER
jgi:Uma2 family endonuclease